MTLLQSGIAKPSSGYDIDQSLRFNPSDTGKLSRTPSSSGNKSTFTISAWAKSCNAGNRDVTLYEAYSDANNYFYVGVDATQLYVKALVASAYTNGGRKSTAARFRDPSAWYHFVIQIDTTQSVAENRIRLYVNGVEETVFEDNAAPSIGREFSFFNNSSYAQNIGYRQMDGVNRTNDAYLAEYHFIDGTALDASSFGETDAATNQWKPIEVTGLTYGTNGFYQKYSATELAASFTDSSRKVNVFTADGTFTIPAGGVTAEILIVAGGGGAGGGGGGGAGEGSGGGAGGGLLEGSSLSLNAGTYSVTVGAGGAGGAAGSDGATGSNSVITETTWGTATALGGGAGGGNDRGGINGGSGGGSGGSGATQTAGAATQGDSNGLTGYGYAGGANPSGHADGAGGGGAGAVGTNSAEGGGAGGAGRASALRTGASVTYASGGQGGDNGSGARPAGAANTGDGGGGSPSGISGSAGGSGIVIVSYPTPSGESGGFHTITANGDVTNTRAQYKIGDSSIKFDGTGDYLSSPDSSDWDIAGSSASHTIEFWVYFNSLSEQYVVNQFEDANNRWVFYLNTDDGFTWLVRSGGSNVIRLDVVGGISADTWHHVALVKNSTRYDIYQDGVSVGNVTDADTDTFAGLLYIGWYGAGTALLNGYMDEIRISDSARYTTTFTPSTTAFVADANTKLLIHSDFDGGLGADSSGNGNDFAVTNLVATDQMIDTPTNNYCTLNPLDNGADFTLSEGNLQASVSGVNKICPSTFHVDSGKWYFEYYLKASPSSAVYGVGKSGTTNWHSDTGTWVYRQINGSADLVWNRDTSTSYDYAYVPEFNAGDLMQVALDMDSGKIWFGRENSWMPDASNNASDPALGTYARYSNLISVSSGSVTPICSNSGGTPDWVLNFGQDSSFAGNKTAQGNGGDGEDFYYTPPAGFKALNSDNIPAISASTFSYVGNANADGPFIYTGYLPSSFTISATTYSLPGYNPGSDVDWLSNGIKVRSSTTRNTNGTTYSITAAPVEQDFKYSNAR